MGVCPIPQGRWAPKPGPLPQELGQLLHGVALPSTRKLCVLAAFQRGKKQAVSLASCSTKAQRAEMSQTVSLSLLHAFLPCTPCPRSAPPRRPPIGSAAGAHTQTVLSAAQGESPQALHLTSRGWFIPGACVKGGRQNCEPPHSLPAPRRPQPLSLGLQKELHVGT